LIDILVVDLLRDVIDADILLMLVLVLGVLAVGVNVSDGTDGWEWSSQLSIGLNIDPTYCS
jgi:cell division protein FtsX